MELTYAQISAIMPGARKSSILKFLPFLNEWMPKYGIVTPVRVRHFLAQIAHESAQLNYVEEIASGAAYDTGRLASNLGNTTAKDGDGQKYKGRGLIQITGTNNYRLLSKDWGIDLLADPDQLETPSLAVRSACWFWWKAGLNKRVDEGYTVKSVTIKINGGTNGLEDRKKFYERACVVIA